MNSESPNEVLLLKVSGALELCYARTDDSETILAYYERYVNEAQGCSGGYRGDEERKARHARDVRLPHDAVVVALR